MSKSVSSCRGGAPARQKPAANQIHQKSCRGTWVAQRFTAAISCVLKGRGFSRAADQLRSEKNLRSYRRKKKTVKRMGGLYALRAFCYRRTLSCLEMCCVAH